MIHINFSLCLTTLSWSVKVTQLTPHLYINLPWTRLKDLTQSGCLRSCVNATTLLQLLNHSLNPFFFFFFPESTMSDPNQISFAQAFFCSAFAACFAEVTFLLFLVPFVSFRFRFSIRNIASRIFDFVG